MLFPHDVARTRAACDEVGALLVYDASHVAGLIAGGRFQRPLDEGAHLVTMSTYMSFGGPPGAAVVTRDEDLARQVSAAAYPGLTANYDASRLAPLAVAAAEHAAGGSAYADRCVANARALAAALDGEGFTVIAAQRGWTASHHVAVDADAFGGGDEAARLLAEGGVYLSGIALPGRPAERARAGPADRHPGGDPPRLRPGRHGRGRDPDAPPAHRRPDPRAGPPGRGGPAPRHPMIPDRPARPPGVRPLAGRSVESR